MPKRSASATPGEENKDGPLPQYSELAIRTNIGILEYSRTCQAAASGMAAGILGLTGVSGFLFYVICVLVQAAVWELKAGLDWRTFFLDRTLSVGHSIVGGLFTYILFWVFLYGMVHVY
uniref:ER membrane protein complex subunit 6 n=1 Tax=Plectus sambesii TaxID=2011161 RepID=A0A914XF40_9BILA